MSDPFSQLLLLVRLGVFGDSPADSLPLAVRSVPLADRKSASRAAARLPRGRPTSEQGVTVPTRLGTRPVDVSGGGRETQGATARPRVPGNSASVWAELSHWLPDFTVLAHGATCQEDEIVGCTAGPTNIQSADCWAHQHQVCRLLGPPTSGLQTAGPTNIRQRILTCVSCCWSLGGHFVGVPTYSTGSWTIPEPDSRGRSGEQRRVSRALWHILSPPPGLSGLWAPLVGASLDRNPSPPPPSCSQEDEEDLAGGDCIGSTVYSKHWLFGVLSGLIQIVTPESGKSGSDDDEQQMELTEETENEICRVWDMSMDENLHLVMDGNRDRDPHWSTGLRSQGTNEEQKEGEHEQRSRDHEGCTHPLRQWS
ncbi:uncharacterized protein LOC142837841 [Microtus pennsylvanicus]|uniref:uncharacterized protein LOC142837841 n=1 Tax=Microtus pennsylvanicus TaxID=10058 RepID=UPI003F6C637F